MNYLAHAYLSFDHPSILVGNMISDFVKGKSRYTYPFAIQKGIELHRAIDTYTDSHPAIHQAKEIFRPAYRLYSAPIIDVVFDHFLANDINVFEEGALYNFSEGVYLQLENNSTHLPSYFLQVLTYMKSENWLFNYRNTDGIEKSLRGLIRRATFVHESNTAFKLFNANYADLNTIYHSFFPDVEYFAKEKIKELVT